MFLFVQKIDILSKQKIRLLIYEQNSVFNILFLNR